MFFPSPQRTMGGRGAQGAARKSSRVISIACEWVRDLTIGRVTGSPNAGSPQRGGLTAAIEPARRPPRRRRCLRLRRRRSLRAEQQRHLLRLELHQHLTTTTTAAAAATAATLRARSTGSQRARCSASSASAPTRRLLARGGQLLGGLRDEQPGLRSRERGGRVPGHRHLGHRLRALHHARRRPELPNIYSHQQLRPGGGGHDRSSQEVCHSSPPENDALSTSPVSASSLTRRGRGPSSGAARRAAGGSAERAPQRYQRRVHPAPHLPTRAARCAG